MKQHVANEQVAVRYADGIDHLWATWEPALRTCERMFGASAWRAGIDGDDAADELRRAQYRAHTAGEFATGLVPPPSARGAHGDLVGSLGMCRDVLGVLAVRAELDELDDDAAEIGLHALGATRDAFGGARSTTALVHAWVESDQVDPQWPIGDDARSSRAWPVVLWLVLGGCATLLALLVAEALTSGTFG